MNDRRNARSQDVLSFGPFSLFVAERLLKRADEAIPLGGRALDILLTLSERAGEVVSHKELISTGRRPLHIECRRSRLLFCCASHALDGRAAGAGHCDRRYRTT